MNSDLLSISCEIFESSEMMKMPDSISIPRPFRIPIPGPVSALSKSDDIRDFMVLFSPSNSDIQPHSLDSKRPFSEALWPSSPRETILEDDSLNSSNPSSSSFFPAPATWTWSSQPVSERSCPKVHSLAESDSIARSILRSLFPRSISTSPFIPEVINT